MNKVLVAVLSWNRQPFTKRFLETFFNGTKEPVDMVIVEQGSAEPAKKLCKSIDGKITENGSTIKVIWNANNVGIPKGLNQAMSLKKPEQHFMKIDNDVIIPSTYPDWLTHMVDIIENTTEKDNMKILGLSPFSPKRPFSERFNLRPVTLKNGHIYNIEQVPHNLLEMGILIANSIVAKVGPFNNNGLMYGYEGVWYQSRATCSKAYFYTCEALHADSLQLLESNTHQSLKAQMLKGVKEANVVLEKFSEDETLLNVKFKE